jgi:Fe2+ transport system protein FeoA
MMQLWSLPPGGAAVIEAVREPGAMGRRLAELGFIPGERVSCLLRRNGIAAYAVRGAAVAIRRQIAARIDTEAAP